MMNTKDTAYVLYVDHQGHPAPLSLSYHATASRRLASAVDRHPPSTLTEVDSAYCPQCLAFHDVNTASNIGYCPKPTCRQCPLCQSIASVTVDEAECLFRCGKCDWTSRECNLFASITLGVDGAVLKEDFDKATSELGEKLKTRMEQQDHWADDHYKNMLKALEGMAKEQVKGQRTTTFSPSFTAANRRGMDGPEGWSVQALEDSIVARGKLVEASVAEIVGGQVVQLVSLEAEDRLDESLKGKPSTCVLLQESGATAKSTQDILPLPIPLRPRKSRRCRAELAEGRPGILVKPKLNPLEGDSSLRTGHGQWWKKDSSAIQVLPRVRVARHGSDGTKHALLIKVSNPTLGVIRLRLQSSEYKGEPEWGSKSDRIPVLEDLLVDPLTQTKINTKLATETVQQLQPTQVCELEAAEDSFLELGKSLASDEPDEVAQWDSAAVLSTSTVSSESSPSTLRLLAQKSAVGWFELVLLETTAENGFHSAVPLALQIEVGEGSWESSLVQPEPVEGEGVKDMATFDLVLAWNNKQ